MVTLDTEQLPDLFEKIRDHYPDAKVQTGDGLRLAWQDRWLLVRGSNTEPLVRLISEAEEQAVAKDMCAQVERLINELE